MISPKLAKAEFDAILRRIDEQGIKLVVSDFNGVLDDYNGTKFEFIAAILGEQHLEQHFARLSVRTDTAYIKDRGAVLEDTIATYCRENGIEISAEGQKLLEDGPRMSVMTPEAREFLGALTVPVVIFTAQKSERLYKSVEREFLEGLNIGVMAFVAKPSVESLQEVLSERGVSPQEACMIGDGLIDDLLPAKLLGMHTVLVSPFADMHVNG